MINRNKQEHMEIHDNVNHVFLKTSYIDGYLNMNKKKNSTE